MKKIEAIVRREKVEDLKDKLGELGVKGILLSNIAGYGQDEMYTQVYRGKAYTFRTVQKMKIEVVVDDDMAENIIQSIFDIAHTGKKGDGKIYIYDIRDAISICTKERGNNAL